MFAEEKLLIITKTYPLPSRNYREHTCVAAINGAGEMRRLFPVPFRLLSEEKRFRRWQWISARIEKASDRRPESYRIDLDSIQVLTQKSMLWEHRLAFLNVHVLSDFEQLDTKRQKNGQTLGIIKPEKYSLEIEAEKEKEWTKSEIDALTQQGLFDGIDVKNRPLLKKLPYRFYYRYECGSEESKKEYRHLITDWEIGMLFFNCQRQYPNDWELKFREKLETEFQLKRELYFLMGTMHRIPDQWLIVGLIYPPKKVSMQAMLFHPLADF